MKPGRPSFTVLLIEFGCMFHWSPSAHNDGPLRPRYGGNPITSTCTRDTDTATTAFTDTTATATDTAIVDQVPKGQTGRAIFNVS